MSKGPWGERQTGCVHGGVSSLLCARRGALTAPAEEVGGLGRGGAPGRPPADPHLPLFRKVGLGSSSSEQELPKENTAQPCQGPPWLSPLWTPTRHPTCSILFQANAWNFSPAQGGDPALSTLKLLWNLVPFLPRSHHCQ